VSRLPVDDRGTRRRQELLDATLVVLAEHGTRGVTHRAVSEAAGASLGLTRYWFTTREQLLEAALRHVAQRDITAMTLSLEAVMAQTPRDELPHRVAAVFADGLAEDRVGALARYELFLEAARNPALGDALRAWGDSYRELIARLLRAASNAQDDGRSTLVLDAVNGLLLEQLATPRSDFLHAVLEPAMVQLLAPPTQSARPRAAPPEAVASR
jgi:DNA-binding transcriptional regulator YbjK